MSRNHPRDRIRSAAPSAPGGAPEAEPSPEDIREALDVLEEGGKHKVVVIAYHKDRCESEVVFESDSGPEAYGRFMALAMKKGHRARTGASHPEGDRILS